MNKGKRLYINITNSCNIDCPFCCMFSCSKKHNYMTFDQYKSIIDSTKTPFELQLEGGEPLLHKNIFLYLEYAVSSNLCKKIIILTNGILLSDEFLKRLISFSSWYSILVELKVSVNYWILKNRPNHLRDISNIAFAIEFIPTISLKLNVRKRNNVDEWIDSEVKKYHLDKIANSYYFQAYGKLLGSTEYDLPVIVQNIEFWELFASDGTSFGHDLIARSNYEDIL